MLVAVELFVLWMVVDVVLRYRKSKVSRSAVIVWCSLSIVAIVASYIAWMGFIVAIVIVTAYFARRW
ncbi:MAG: hypothetical protein P6D49_00380 [Acidimicrobiales bacterium]|jgi:chromate transport protein ChrA|nr:hypothetical protein [Acidimicrobiales bacterium]